MIFKLNFQLTNNIFSPSKSISEQERHEIKNENDFHQKFKNNKILSDKSPKYLDLIDENEIERKKKMEEMKIMTETQRKYESQLKKMGIPVINGLVSHFHFHFV
jgi:hypothetical protein